MRRESWKGKKKQATSLQRRFQGSQRNDDSHAVLLKDVTNVCMKPHSKIQIDVEWEWWWKRTCQKDENLPLKPIKSHALIQAIFIFLDK